VKALWHHVLEEAAHEFIAGDAACPPPGEFALLQRIVTASSSRSTMRELVMATRKT